MHPVSQKNIYVGEVANGLPLTIPVYHLKGNGTGKSVYIQANMHGAEVQGNAVIYQLLEQLQTLELNGDITLVPYANPIGCNQKSGEFTLGRFDPITGVNWNRMYHYDSQLPKLMAEQCAHLSSGEIRNTFQHALIASIDAQLEAPAHTLSTGKRIALQLQQLAHQADIVLDLHTGPISTQHLYCPEYARASAKYFNIANVLLIPNEFDGALDEAAFCPWWQLKAQLNALDCAFEVPVEAFTVELGSQERIDLSAAKDDADNILTYLNYQGVLQDAPFYPKEMTRYGCMLSDYKTYYAPMGGMVEYLAPLGEPIAAGTPIANILRMERYLSETPLHTLCADSDAIAILHFASASVNQGTELYKFFTNTFEL